MIRYLAGILALCLLVLVSIIYKQNRTNALLGFEKGDPAQASEPVLYLYGFFSSDSCMPCGEVIGVLNQLPDYFKVTGVVPKREAHRIGALREQYKIQFPIHDPSRYRRYRPLINPTENPLSMYCPPQELLGFDLFSFRIKSGTA
ncbi:MAG: hypothetical protein FJY79_05015 [Candidatus Aminicenantes bacterium]|nr:hypothetical protein [Candidatus Aminicenantes bacterium]